MDAACVAQAHQNAKPGLGIRGPVEQSPSTFHRDWERDEEVVNALIDPLWHESRRASKSQAVPQRP